jgi:hypothetical protein
MYDEVAYQLALRSKLLTLTVTTTGAISLAATTTGYTRTTGSFITDGLQPGMEITPAGFANNSPAIITDVAALTIKAQRLITTVVNGVTTYALGAITAEVAAGGRSLTVGLPTNRAWENDAFEPTAGIPYVREEFVPGPTQQITIGPFGELEGTPMYALYFNCPAGSRLTAKRYVQAARVLFAPRTEISASNGDTIRVRADTGPYAGQLLTSTPGFAVQPFTIPLRVRSANII